MLILFIEHHEIYCEERSNAVQEWNVFSHCSISKLKRQTSMRYLFNLNLINKKEWIA